MATEADKPTAAATNGGSQAKPAKELPSTDPNLAEDSTVAPPSDDGSGKEAVDDKEGLDSKSNTADAGSGNADSITDTERKIRRAERFGISVQFSEKEKRNSRAERFGTPSTTQGSEAAKTVEGAKTAEGTKTAEELKRKARAERFGLPVTAEPTDDAAKKKARLERFGSIPKPDAAEDDKRKARALRFAEPSPTSLSLTEEGDIQPDAAIAGKAGGGS
ncbi:unnamed protein product [Linum tenue]|uniref:THO1-MOS11 C-terminal domain-containing protein n=1 Tax=Linum tenue TaxID=586396 RepID=A0AAV0PKL3_9ROSI|nr:unnamed protein product [Linum tenue]CAI0472501.1 unnamed protein product [Linum tenue]